MVVEQRLARGLPEHAFLDDCSEDDPDEVDDSDEEHGSEDNSDEEDGSEDNSDESSDEDTEGETNSESDSDDMTRRMYSRQDDDEDTAVNGEDEDGDESPVDRVRRLDRFMDLLHAQYIADQDHSAQPNATPNAVVEETSSESSESDSEESDASSSEEEGHGSDRDVSSSEEESSDCDCDCSSEEGTINNENYTNSNANVVSRSGRATAVGALREWLAQDGNGQSNQQSTIFAHDKERRVSTEAARAAFQRYLRRISAVPFTTQLL